MLVRKALSSRASLLMQLSRRPRACTGGGYASRSYSRVAPALTARYVSAWGTPLPGRSCLLQGGAPLGQLRGCSTVAAPQARAALGATQLLRTALRFMKRA